MPIVHKALSFGHEEGHTDVCYSSDGQNFTTCGTDGDIRIWSIHENSEPVHKCVGEWARCVRQKGNSLYVSTGSNDIQIMSFPEGERNGVLDRFVAPINCIATNTASNHMALGGEDMELRIIDLETSQKTLFKGLMGPCLSVALSPDSSLIAASSGDGKLRIWDVETQQIVREFDCFPKVNSFGNVHKLCRLDFRPYGGKILAYPLHDSVVMVNCEDWDQVDYLKCRETDNDFSLLQFSPCGKFLAASTTGGEVAIFDANTKAVHSFTKHPKSVNITGFMWNPLSNGQIVYTDKEGCVGLMSGCVSQQADTVPPVSAPENTVNFDGFEFEYAEEEDEENVISLEKIKKQVMGEDDELEDELQSVGLVPSPRPRTPQIPQQAPFIPSSTPEHLNPRYLCWNEVGIVRSYGDINTDDEDSAEKSIEVEFHDSTFHKNLIIQNYRNYFMGVVNKSALVLASSVHVYVVPLGSDSKEWYLNSGGNYEEITLIGTSENLVCVSTNKYMVRVCSIHGTQRGVFSIPGPAVSLACFKNNILVVYHKGAVTQKDQNFGAKFVNFKSSSFISREIDFCMSPETTLAWVGFTEKGSPAAMDSSGILRLFPPKCNAWIPICDTGRHLKNPSDGFFVTAIFEALQTVAGVRCKGSQYPTFTPRPTACELPLEAPFLEPETEKTQQETKLFTVSNLKCDSGKESTVTGVKLFSLACKNHSDRRALELMEILMEPQLMSLCLKYSLKVNKKRLAEKLNQLLENPENGDEEDEFFNKDIVPSSFEQAENLLRSSLNSQPLNTFSTRKITLSKKTLKKTTPSKIGEAENAKPCCSSYEDISITTSMDVPFDFPIPKMDLPKKEPISRNPFWKNLKKDENSPGNPLSLVDKSAGVDFEAPKLVEKRKSETEPVNPKGKQRKLDKFMLKAR